MIDCHRLSDRMLEVARGAAVWSPDDQRHLAQCEACRFEWELIERTRRLGTDTSFRLDETAVAGAVLRRMRAADSVAGPGGRRRAWAAVGLAAAAGVVLLMWGRTGSERPAVVAPPESVIATAPAPSVSETVTSVVPAPKPRVPAGQVPVAGSRLELGIAELEGLNADELAPILESLNEPFSANELLRSPGLSDLDGRRFEHALGMEEG